MSKNTDFFKLGPYSRKNSIRTENETKIRQTESKQTKLAVPRTLTRQQRAGSAWSRAREGASRKLHAHPLPRSRGSTGPVGSARVAVWHGLQATRVDASLELRCSRRWSTRVRCLSPPSATHRPTFFFLSFFLLSSLPSENQNTVLFSDFYIFRSVGRIDMIPSAKF